MGDAPPPTPPQAGRINTGREVTRRVAITAFGAYIAVTSAVGISLGLHAGEGWLAIIYGALGVSMGVAGMAGVWMKGALRGFLLGWLLVGVASRAILEGDAYLAAITSRLHLRSSPRWGLLLYRRSAAKALGAAAGGCLAILALPALAITAPSMPAICSSAAAFGRSQSTVFRYPATTLFDTAEERYTERCYTPIPPPP